MPKMPGSAVAAVLGHYHLAEKIGSGGMGEVYRARDQHLERDAAVKVLPPGLLADEAARHRFRKEALALSRLNHPNIETVFDFDTDQGVDYLATEYIPGCSLDEKIASGALPEKEVARLGAQLADGLAAAHAEGIIHRDLKPANLRLTGDGRLKILDFGLAKLIAHPPDAATESMSQSMRFAGTLPYMAPEQVLGGQLDARTDLWAAGAVLYEMATGRRPFPADGLHVTDEILHHEPAPPRFVKPGLSPALEAIIVKCLDKDPGARYQSAAELAVDLRRLTHGSSPAATSAVRSGRRFWFLAAALLALVLAAAAAMLLWLRRESAAAPAIHSLAVLPLASMSGTPNQDYFADGMTEALITRLSQISALRVLSRTSVLQYKDTKKSVPQIARELGVDAVVEGSVLRVGDRVRITAQLIAANPERHLWAEDYDRDFKDILQVHSEVAQAIVRQVRVHVSPGEQQSLGQARPVNPEAHDAYLRGRYLGTRFAAAPLQQARQHLQDAVEKDPTYAPAWAELAHVYIKLNGAAPRRDKTLLVNAKAAAEKAIETDPNLGSAHMVLAIATTFIGGDLPTVVREADRALELAPNSADVLMHGCLLRVLQHREAEGIAMAERGLQLEPLDFEVNHLATQMWVATRQYDRAIEQAQRTLELDPNSAPTYVVLANAYEAKKDYPHAVAALEKSLTLSSAPAAAIASLRQAFAAQGMRGVYLWRLARLDENATKTGEDNPYSRALVYCGLGNKERAIQLLEQAYQRQDSNLITIGINYHFDALRSDPRFQALLAKIGLPQ